MEKPTRRIGIQHSLSGQPDLRLSRAPLAPSPSRTRRMLQWARGLDGADFVTPLRRPFPKVLAATSGTRCCRLWLSAVTGLITQLWNDRKRATLFLVLQRLPKRAPESSSDGSQDPWQGPQLVRETHARQHQRGAAKC